MEANYNLALRINPGSDSKEKLWYAIPAGKGTMDENETAAMAVADTTLSKGEFMQVMGVASYKLMPLILSGITITIGDLGKLRLSFGSTGVADMDDFDPQTMIKNLKFIFTPSKVMKEELNKATFKLEDIIEDGIKYGSKKSYQKAKGLIEDTGSEPDDDEEQGIPNP